MAAATEPDRHMSTATDLSAETLPKQKSEQPSLRQRALDTLLWMPPWCRWIPGKPPKFTIWMNLLYAAAGTFTVANLYYNHPILNVLAESFGVSNETAAQVPTLMQGGYAVGLFFLCPLGDTVRRRPFILLLVFISATIWIGLCVTNNFTAFRALSFLAAVTTVTPQMVLPLVGDLAPPEKRAQALSFVVSGNFLGLLVARILSGVVAQYTSWRNVYWLALGLQYAIWVLLFCFMPDYPKMTTEVPNYFKVLWSMVCMLKKHPVLVQSSMVAFCVSSGFTNYWTTLTFLLAGDPYHYSTLIIGLFALIGIAGMALGPVYAKLFIERCVPAVSLYIGLSIDLICLVIGTYTGTFTVAGPIIQAFGLDAGLQISQIANRAQIYAVEPTGRSRVNTVLMLFTFLGQITGTSAGNRLYARSGWIGSGSLSVATAGFAILVVTARGPYEKGWVGWSGGWSILKRNRMTGDGMTAEQPPEMLREAQAQPEVNEKADIEATAGSTGDEEKNMHAERKN